MEFVSFADAAAVLLAAAVGAMGLGGGSILVLYLTFYRHYAQLQAQGINLFFFLPCAAVAVIIFIRQKIIQWDAVIPLCCGGFVGVLLGGTLLKSVPTKYVTVFFSCFLLFSGIRTLFAKTKSEKKP